MAARFAKHSECLCEKLVVRSYTACIKKVEKSEIAFCFAKHLNV